MARLKMSKFLSALFLLVSAHMLAAQDTALGRLATPAEIDAWNIDIRPDGLGLPEGQGNVLRGEELFTGLCSGCHGDFGEGVARYPALAGGAGTLTDERPLKTIGSYWPHLSTVYDYIRRAQPFGTPGDLTDDEIYALTAYLLYLNDLVEEDFVLTSENFAQITLPNTESFTLDGRETEPFPSMCMTQCGEARSISRRASDLGLE